MCTLLIKVSTEMDKYCFHNKWESFIIRQNSGKIYFQFVNVRDMLYFGQVRFYSIWSDMSHDKIILVKNKLHNLKMLGHPQLTFTPNLSMFGNFFKRMKSLLCPINNSTKKSLV